MPVTTGYPYSAVTRVTVTIGGIGYEGSGVMISPDEVLTASHLLWTEGVGVSASVVVMPGYNNDVAPFGTYTGVAAHYNTISDAGGRLTLADIGNDYAIIHLTSPVPWRVGTMALGAGYDQGGVTVSGYPGGTGMRSDLAETVTTSTSSNVLVGTSLGPGSSGGPVWIGGASGATVVGTVSAGTSSDTTGYFSKITTATLGVIRNWVAQDDAVATPPPTVGWIDAASGLPGGDALTAAVGGPDYLQWSYIWSGAGGVSLSTSAPNVFLHGGSGQDSLQVASGQNVLDGGTGSNFLTGGTGYDTFFTDARGTAVVWNTLRNFHAGDAATLWGFVPGVSSFHWDAETAGAAGSTGATLRANIVGGTGRNGDGIDASITFAGLSVDQAKGLKVVTGTQPAGSYLYLSSPV